MVSVFVDTNFFHDESVYLAKLFTEHCSSTDSTCTSVILQNLWKEYGIVFADDALLYSVLAWASSFECRFEGSGKRLNDHLTYKAKFQSSLRLAIRRDEITDSHFFAALFAVLTSFHEISASGERTLREFKADNDELKAHQQGLLQILRRLRSRHGPLQYLYNYALSLVRLWASESAVANINYDMHLVAEETPLPMTVTDPRATFALPARFWLDTGGTPTWQGLEWSMSDDIRALFSCFQMMLNGSDPNHSIRTLRQKITDMQRLPCVSAIFSFVPTSFSCSCR